MGSFEGLLEGLFEEVVDELAVRDVFVRVGGELVEEGLEVGGGGEVAGALAAAGEFLGVVVVGVVGGGGGGLRGLVLLERGWFGFFMLFELVSWLWLLLSMVRTISLDVFDFLIVLVSNLFLFLLLTNIPLNLLFLHLPLLLFLLLTQTRVLLLLLSLLLLLLALPPLSPTSLLLPPLPDPFLPVVHLLQQPCGVHLFEEAFTIIKQKWILIRKEPRVRDKLAQFRQGFAAQGF